jgi:DNA-binding beta-propeller fold protein YncE
MCAAVFLSIIAGVVVWAAGSERTSYHIIGKYKIAGDGGWDYITIDSAARWLYVAHGSRLEILDADSGNLVGQVPNLGDDLHGAAIAPELQRGFTSNGAARSVTVFNTRTLRPIKTVSVAGTDFILYEPLTQRVFPLNQRITVLNAKSGQPVGELDLGSEPEAAVSDGKGNVYLSLAHDGLIAIVNAETLEVTRSLPIERCEPHTLLYDDSSRRLFVGCRDRLAVLDPVTGKVVARTLMCSGVDGAAWDGENKLIFESCKEGVVSIIRQRSPEYYELVDTVKTELYSGTMAFDPQTKRIFLPSAKIRSVPNPGVDPSPPYKLEATPDSFAVLVLGRVPTTISDTRSRRTSPWKRGAL